MLAGSVLLAVSRVEIARHEWAEGTRKLEAVREEPARYRQLLELHELVLDELRKRVGQTFTLEDLAKRYAAADEWVRDTVSERAPTPGWPRTLSLVQDAAFHLYQRGAVDYAP